jgi:hypothetical protein
MHHTPKQSGRPRAQHPVDDPEYHTHCATCGIAHDPDRTGTRKGPEGRGRIYRKHCRNCENAQASAWRKSPKGRAYRKQYVDSGAAYRSLRKYHETSHGVSHRRHKARRSRERHPVMEAARYLVRALDWSGRIKRSQCFFHGPECLGRLEWHHPYGYEPPNDLRVVCVCKRHHYILDRRAGELSLPDIPPIVTIIL